MRLSREANEYIRLVSSVGENRKLFNDANFEENRQKTTEKSRCRSKVLKMYDKSFEYRSKGKAVESNILRLETSYRRQNIPLSEFFNDAFCFSSCIAVFPRLAQFVLSSSDNSGERHKRQSDRKRRGVLWRSGVMLT